VASSSAGLLHRVEIWMPDLDRAVASWGWLLDQLGGRVVLGTRSHDG
jgi:hypothetical protein